MRKFLTSLRLLEGVAVILETVKIEEVDQTMVEIETVIESITAEETETMTLEVEVEVQGVILEVAAQAIALVVVQETEENLVSTGTTDHLRVQAEAVGEAAITRVSRAIITLAVEILQSATQTGFDIRKTLNAAYDWDGHT